jgi:hypothetical protein
VTRLTLLTPARDSAPTYVGDYNQVAADVSPRKSLRMRGSDSAEFESPFDKLGAGLLTSAATSRDAEVSSASLTSVAT